MSDAGRLAEWKPGFEDWKQASMPLLQQGKAKQAFARYPWFSTDQVPFARLGRPASEARFALITTGGYSIEGEQAPFRPLPNLDGSAPEIREIPLDVDRAKLRIDHPGYDHRFAEEDLNVNLPLDRLNELVAAGEIGSISPNT